MLEYNVSLSGIKRIGNIAACIGYFDGLHLGHQQLVNKTIQLAKENRLSSALITFDPDPWVVLKGIGSIEHITSIEQRKKIVADLGIDIWISIEFTKELAALDPNVFIDEVITALGVKELVCGFDFSFGKFGIGTTETLQSCDKFNTTVIEAVKKEGVKISSTLIEENIIKGNVKLANELLTRPFTIISTVIHGRNRGKGIGFPTANIDVNGIYVIPKVGVYAGSILYANEKYSAVINVGYNPTFNKRDDISIECHLINFEGDLYGETIEVEFLDFLREERKFANVAELTEQINKDIEHVKESYSNR